MSKPVNNSDHVYSDPEAIAVTWDQKRAVLESAELFGSPVSGPKVGLMSPLSLPSGPKMQSGFQLASKGKILPTYLLIRTMCSLPDAMIGVRVGMSLLRVTRCG